MALIDGSADCEVALDGRGPAPDADFSRLIEAEIAFLRQTARRWQRDRANAEDLVQDTLLQALANGHQWEAGSNLRGWLFTIMRNQFLAATARSKRSDVALDAIAVVARECGPSGGPTEARLVMRDVERALLRLASPQRTAVRLIGIDGKSYEEAARLMGMSVAAVRCHLSRGRECLKTIVEGTDAAPPQTRRAKMSQRVASDWPLSPVMA